MGTTPSPVGTVVLIGSFLMAYAEDAVAYQQDVLRQKLRAVPRAGRAFFLTCFVFSY